MANWNLPDTSSLYTVVLSTLNTKLASVAARDFTSDTNFPTGTQRWNGTLLREEAWSGAAWVPLFTWTAWTPTYGTITGGATFTSVTTNYAAYRIHGKTLYFTLSATGSTNGTATSGITFSLPGSYAAADIDQIFWAGASTAPAVPGFAFMNSGTVIAVSKADHSNFPTSVSGVSILTGGVFEIT